MATIKVPTAAKPAASYKPTAKEKPTKGTAIIYDKNGKVTAKIETNIKDGAMYDSKTGKIVSSNHGSSGMYNDPSGYTKTYDSKTKTGYWTPKEEEEEKKKKKKKKSPPARPSFISFNEPIPTFKSSLKEQHKFIYYSGIDSIELKKVDANKEVCFISKYINIGELVSGEYLEFDAIYSCDEDSSIEFYMLDGEEEIPIIPSGDVIIKNEKVFSELSTRFSIDASSPIIVKNKTSISNLSLSEAKEKLLAAAENDSYNVTYSTKASRRILPINKNIRIKAIIRAYGESSDSPYIKSMKFKKFGGSTLWNQNT